MIRSWLRPLEELLRGRETGTRIEWSIILALFAVSAALSIVASLLLVHKIGEVTNPEGAVTVVALHFAKTGSLYTSLDRPPYTPVAYGPGLYVALAAMARCFHLDFLGLLFAGRVLSLICFLSLAAMMYFGAVRCGFRGWIAASPAICLISDYWFKGWNATVRPDMAGVLLSTTCIALILVPTRRTVVVGAVCAALALSLKLTFIAAPFSALLWLIWNRRYVYAAWFAITCAGTILMFAAFFLMRKDPIVSQVFIQRNVTLSFGALVSSAQQQWRYDSTKFILATCFTGLWYAVTQREKNKSQAMLIGLYVLFAWLVAVITSVNIGAAENYYLEPRAASTLALPFGIHALEQFWNRMAPIRAFLMAAVFLAFVLQPILWTRVITATAKDQKPANAIARIITGKKILSTDSYFAALSSEPEMLDPFLMRDLEIRGQWSSEPILTKVRAQYYDFVIFRTDAEGKVTGYHGQFFFDDGVTAAIQRKYVPFCATSKHLILLPSRPTSVTEATDLEQAGCHGLGGTFETYVQK